MIENAMASGMRASATTRPAKISFRVLENHSWRIVSIDVYFLGLARAVREGNAAGFPDRCSWRRGMLSNADVVCIAPCGLHGIIRDKIRDKRDTR